VGLLNWLFGSTSADESRREQRYAAEPALSREMTACAICGEVLYEWKSGRIASLLHLSSWPCPRCDIGASHIGMREHGFRATNGGFF
jgi:hypothetical protein